MAAGKALFHLPEISGRWMRNRHAATAIQPAWRIASFHSTQIPYPVFADHLGHPEFSPLIAS
jgi:hypothetical protein